MRDMRNVCEILVGKPEEERPLGRPRRRWKGDDIVEKLGELKQQNNVKNV
jgi:hypothetical protein